MERGHLVRLSAQRERNQSALCHESERALPAGGQDARAPSTCSHPSAQYLQLALRPLPLKRNAQL
jgi:hypothetical protein